MTSQVRNVQLLSSSKPSKDPCSLSSSKPSKDPDGSAFGAPVPFLPTSPRGDIIPWFAFPISRTYGVGWHVARFGEMENKRYVCFMGWALLPSRWHAGSIRFLQPFENDEIQIDYVGETGDGATGLATGFCETELFRISNEEWWFWCTTEERQEAGVEFTP